MKYSQDKRVYGGRGFTLVETMVAITILILAIVGPMTIASRGLQSAFFAKEQFIAVSLNQEAIEFVRRMRDENALNGNGWLDGIPASCNEQDGCGIDVRSESFVDCYTTDACRLNYDSSALSGNRGFYTYMAGNPTQFTRRVHLFVNGDEAEVRSTVSWQSSIYPKTLTTQTIILNEFDNL